MTAAEILELAGIETSNIAPDSIRDVTYDRAGGRRERIITFTASTAAGTLRGKIEVAP